jgi:hypothetical protein
MTASEFKLLSVRGDADSETAMAPHAASSGISPDAADEEFPEEADDLPF